MTEINIPDAAAAVLARLESAGYESYVVGGCVRDALLGREPKDWDICTSATPQEVERVFCRERLIETGLKHGTVTLLTALGPTEITTFRADGTYSDGRRPDRVDFISDIHEDLARRDFTVNAMAYSPLRGLRDDFCGCDDLRAGVIRCVGNADERLREDALRILRALRFAARYGFAIEAETAEALRRNAALLKNVSAERIFSEVRGILCGQGAGAVLRTFPEIAFTVLPELSPLYGFDQHRVGHCYDAWEHTLHAVDAAPQDDILRLTMLLHDCGKPEVFHLDETGVGRFIGHPAAGAKLAERILRRLRCDNETLSTVKLLVENHEMRTGHETVDLRRLLSRIGEENMRRLLCVRRADAASHAPEAGARLLALADEDERRVNAILDSGCCLSLKELAVSGRELMAHGIPASPKLGKLLARLFDEVLGETLENSRDALLHRADELWETMK